MTCAAKTLGVLLALAALRLPLAALLGVLLPDASVAPVAFCLSTAAQSALLYGLPGLLLRRNAAAGVRRSLHRAWLLTPVLALAAFAALPELNALWQRTAGLTTTLLPMPEGWRGLLVAALAYAVIPAASEEVFFRGALLGALEQRTSRWTALALTTLLFALMHGSLAGLPGHLAISLLLTLTMQASGCLLIPMGLHMLYNLLVLLLPRCGGWLTLAGGAALLAAAVWLLPRSAGDRERPGLSRVEMTLAAVCLLLMAAIYGL